MSNDCLIASTHWSIQQNIATCRPTYSRKFGALEFYESVGRRPFKVNAWASPSALKLGTLTHVWRGRLINNAQRAQMLQPPFYLPSKMRMFWVIRFHPSHRLFSRLRNHSTVSLWVCCLSAPKVTAPKSMKRRYSIYFYYFYYFLFLIVQYSVVQYSIV